MGPLSFFSVVLRFLVFWPLVVLVCLLVPGKIRLRNDQQAY